MTHVGLVRATGCAVAHPGWLIVSFNDEGFHRPADVLRLLSSKGYVRCAAIDAKRYVGAQIGIHDPTGVRVGTVSHLRNKEILFVAGPDEERVEAALSGALDRGQRDELVVGHSDGALMTHVWLRCVHTTMVRPADCATR